MIVFDREGGLTQKDLEAIGHLGVGLNRLEITGATPIIDPFTADASQSLGSVATDVHGIGPLSRDGDAALVVLALNASDRGAVKHGVHWRTSRWARVAAPVQRRSRVLIAFVVACLLLLALGNLAHHGTIGFGQGETRPNNSGRGTTVLNEHFPPGLGSPLTAVVPASEAGRVVDGMKRLGAVRLAVPVPPFDSSDRAVVAVVLAGNPYSGEAAEHVERIGERLHAISPGSLLGGIPAENYDIE